LQSKGANILGTNSFQAHFNTESNNIKLPKTAYKIVEANVKAIAPTSIFCGDSLYNGCYYKDACGNIFHNFDETRAPALTFNFGDEYYWTMPYTADVIDGDNYYCYVTIVPYDDEVMANSNVIDIGLPFFKAFTATFDTLDRKIGIAQMKFTSGSVSA
jgi:hypothetical protein